MTIAATTASTLDTNARIMRTPGTDTKQSVDPAGSPTGSTTTRNTTDTDAVRGARIKPRVNVTVTEANAERVREGADRVVTKAKQSKQADPLAGLEQHVQLGRDSIAEAAKHDKLPEITHEPTPGVRKGGWMMDIDDIRAARISKAMREGLEALQVAPIRDAFNEAVQERALASNADVGASSITDVARWAELRSGIETSTVPTSQGSDHMYDYLDQSPVATSYEEFLRRQALENLDMDSIQPY